MGCTILKTSHLCSSNERILCGVQRRSTEILCTAFPTHLVMNEMRKQVREDHERWRKSDPGLGGLCGNMDRGISTWGEEAMTGRRKKRAGDKTIPKCQKDQSRDPENRKKRTLQFIGSEP